MQLLGYLQKTVAVVHEIRGFGVLAQRAFGGKVNTQRAYLNSMLILGVVTCAHLHVEGA